MKPDNLHRIRELPVRADPRLCPVEKETSINIPGGSDRADVQSYRPSAIRGFLAQPEFVVGKLITKIVRGEECIIGVRGSLPVACLKIGRPRSTNHLSRVFARRGRRCMKSNVRRSDANPIPPFASTNGGDS